MAGSKDALFKTGLEGTNQFI